MSGPNDQKVPPQQQEYYPPPPPGPPPGYANPLASHPTPQYAPPQQGVPQHPNEQPIPDYYNTQQQHQHNPAYHEPSQAELYGTDDSTHAQHGTAASGAPTKSSWSTRLADKVSSPLNALANKLGSEAFLPGTMDKECEKAARILRGFCKDGIYSDPSTTQTAGAGSTDFKPPPTTAAQPNPDPKKKSRVLLTIPPKVIARAQGLAIFTTVRAGFHVSGASGSGILVSRMADGSWSPPSGIQVHSLGAGFVVGLDIYDCVVVINTREALEAFTRTRMSLGSDLAVTAGPWGAGGSVDFEVPQGDSKRKGREGDNKSPVAAQQAGTDHVYPAQGTTNPAQAPLAAPATGTSKDRKPSPFREAIKKPVYSYVKSRGFYAGVQVDGTVITERKEANAAFYGDKNVTVDRILKGDVRRQTGGHLWPDAARELMSVLAAAERGMAQGQAQPQTTVNQAPDYAPGHNTYATPAAHAPAPGYAHPQGHAPGLGYGAPPNYPPGTSTSGVTEGIRNIDIHDHAGPARETTPPLPPRGSKAAEAAAEARANEPLPAGPPSYQEHPVEPHHHGGEMPPAYEGGGAHGGGVGDQKGPGGPGGPGGY